MATELPKYKGYTIDFRQGEFRKVETDKEGNPEIEFISFASDKGDEMLGNIIAGRNTKLAEEAIEAYQAMKDRAHNEAFERAEQAEQERAR